MGFWDTVGKAAKAVADGSKEFKERRAQYDEEMSSKSDRELARIVVNEHSRSPLKATSARVELRNRGYSDIEDVKRLV